MTKKYKEILADVQDRAEVKSRLRGFVVVDPYGKEKESYCITRAQLNRLIKQGHLKLNRGLSGRVDTYTHPAWPFKLTPTT